MPTADDVKIALIACAEAELNRKISTDEINELVTVFNSHKNLQASNRISNTLDQFCRGKKRLLTDSVTASDNVSRKIIDLENIIKTWSK